MTDAMRKQRNKCEESFRRLNKHRTRFLNSGPDLVPYHMLEIKCAHNVGILNLEREFYVTSFVRSNGLL